ncbi:MAG: aspartate aminotransferase family protein [Asgard group archaeon]|nr:aspartate aminotransferase family protein [Asgard group archaeon]
MNEIISKEKKQYIENHKKSQKLWKESQKIFPAGVSHNIRDFNMSTLNLWPPFIQNAKGSHIFDVDNNDYLDYWITHGSAILGHAPEAVQQAIKKQLPKGNHYGMVNEHAVNLAKKIIHATPSIKELRFCSTGTEATMYASHLARAYTNKKTILKIKGGWHGGNDTLFYFVKHFKNGIETQGIRSVEEANILTFQYNDVNMFRSLLKQHKKDIAAVVMEPVMGAGGTIKPENDFLKIIREETLQNDILLIFDEIITGFRLSFHSGQGYFGVNPDITTLGKIVGGGAPIGVIGGREDILEQANLLEGGKVWIGGGTFSGNPISMVAGKAIIDTLEKQKDSLYSRLNKLGEKLRNGIRQIIKDYNIPATVTGIGSMSSFHWLKKKPRKKPVNSSEIFEKLDSKKSAYNQLLMFNRGILVRGGLGYLSAAHQPNDVEKTIKTIRECTELLSKI